MSKQEFQIDLQNQYSPYPPGVAQKIRNEWRSYVKSVGGLEGEDLLDLIKKGVDAKEALKIIDDYKSVR